MDERSGGLGAKRKEGKIKAGSEREETFKN